MGRMPTDDSPMGVPNGLVSPSADGADRPGVNDYAHIFGVAGGFALGLLFTRLRPPE